MNTPPVPKPLPVEIVPGIIYSPLAKRARVHGTGLEVWEIIRVYRMAHEDFERLQRSFRCLTPEQLRTALDFAEKNREFIESKLAEADATPQRLQEIWEIYPDTKPPHLR
jgi:uncharacterized protein (DUF433 family)